MMSMVTPFLALAALLAVALAYASLGVASALAPLCAVGSVVLWFTLGGCCDLLAPAGYVFYAAAALCAAWFIWRHAVKKMPLPRLGFGFGFFVVAACAFILLLGLRQPMFMNWDEFSFWGTAAKLTKLSGQLYTTAPIGWAWAATQNPALIVFGYFFQFFGGAFCEWQVYAAYDVLQLAALAAVLAPVERRWPVALPLSLIGLLAPYFFTQRGVATVLSPAWMDSYADTPMAFLFAAVLAAYYAGRVATPPPDEKRPASLLPPARPPTGHGPQVLRWLPVFLAAATLTLTKDIALVPALVAVAVIFADRLFAWPKVAPRFGARIKAAALGGGLSLAAVVLPFLGWSAYLGLAAGVDRAASAGGVRQIGLFQLPFTFLAELFSPDKSERFLAVLGGMAQRMASERISMLGSPLRMLVLIAVLLLGAALLSKSRVQRRRCLWFGVGTALGFLAYFCIIAISYIYIMRPEQMFEGYERYIYPYFMAWFLLAALLFGISATGAAGRWRTALGQGAALALCAVVAGRCVQLVPPSMALLDVHPSASADRHIFQKQVLALRHRLPQSGKTFIVSSGDSGLRWFMYCYEMLPWQVDYSFGGGELVRRTLQPDGTTEKHELTADEWADYLLENACTTVLLDEVDEGFRQRYGALFSDGLAAYDEEKTQLYGVVAGAGDVRLEPLWLEG
ncbi:MAG: hypothetical protein AB7V55_00180 [Oscillospiraceae bacterium]